MSTTKHMNHKTTALWKRKSNILRGTHDAKEETNKNNENRKDIKEGIIYGSDEARSSMKLMLKKMLDVRYQHNHRQGKNVLGRTLLLCSILFVYVCFVVICLLDCLTSDSNYQYL